jgi:4'-phosphopantetheinyl transferase EntD
MDSPAGDVPRDLDAPAVPFLKRRHQPRRRAESAAVRLVATCGIVGIAVALAAILGTQDVAAWIIGLVVSVTSVVLAALLWSSRTL